MKLIREPYLLAEQVSELPVLVVELDDVPVLADALARYRAFLGTLQSFEHLGMPPSAAIGQVEAATKGMREALGDYYRAWLGKDANGTPKD